MDNYVDKSHHVSAKLIYAIPATARDLPEFMIFTYGLELTKTRVKALADAGFNTKSMPSRTFLRK